MTPTSPTEATINTRSESRQSMLTWRKSQRSIPKGDCVEVAFTNQRVLMRDSHNPDGGTLQFTSAAWRILIEDLKRGDLDGSSR